jgi:hypothetical protein
MKQEDVIKLWQEANGWSVKDYKNTLEDLERFAQRVEKHTLSNIDPSKFMSCQEMMEAARLAEREACAKLCDSFQERDVGMQPAECAGAIRARGKQA